MFCFPHLRTLILKLEIVLCMVRNKLYEYSSCPHPCLKLDTVGVLISILVGE